MVTQHSLPDAADVGARRRSDQEIARSGDLVRLLPRNRGSVLDIGARDAHFSVLMTEHFEHVTALDLSAPVCDHPRVTVAAGDVTRLDFPDKAFDCVFCAEVLEHIPAVEKACAEIQRVARHEIIIGVPYNQDLRLGRTTCRSCGKTNPPWGHVNSFDEKRLQSLFSGCRVVEQSYVGSTRGTNALSAWLMDLAGNPWGSYGQYEACLHCGSIMKGPQEPRALWSKITSKTAAYIQMINRLSEPQANWIHTVFSKK